ncbi:hypothetical protein X777_15925 [Ooceraea biroi]|uniref:DUF4817 domain-containing protein n=1 Tax=Ooceraea biroi TaxID=2015173 RepID=A0A026WTE2_OOCBI|nr:hypothetical protein X777_02771 [Ooceraea biroi]EZA59282.1 hypothetical protein X777_15925 [Ooceraea biroi]
MIVTFTTVAVRFQSSCQLAITIRIPKVFSNEEYTDIHFVYGFCDGNARAAVREYQRRFPNRRVPDRFKATNY